MTENEQQQLHEALNRAQAEGNPWVAFNDRPGLKLQPYALHYFASASEAERFCDKVNYQIDPFEPGFGFENHVFTPIDTLKTTMGFSFPEPMDADLDMVAIARQMAEQSLHTPPGISFIEMEDGLSQGFVYPVIWQRSVDPLKEIAEYQVVGHQHSGGQIYETGHSHRLLESFGSYRDARAFMDNAVLYNELADKGTDYLLVGRFHGRSLDLDMEGYALPHSGLTLVTAHHNYEHGHDYHELHSPFEPALISQYFFAGATAGELRLYNDKLEPTTVASSQQPFYPTHFINDYLTIKNSNKMINENSYDYVKNQLLYLGFGEEIAQPLRAKMEEGLAEFTLPHARKFGPDETNSVLHFSKGDQKDMTFFNRFDTTLKQPGKEDLTQTFFVGREHNYTLQERYNMMDGRAAYREQPVMRPVEENGETRMKPTGEKYIAWKALNFKESDRYGNFLPKTMFWNHQKELAKYPIKGIEENYNKQRLLAPLEKGNKVDVTLLVDGREMQAKIVANPRMARLDFYDSNGQNLIVRKVEKQAVDQTQKVEMTPQEVQRAAIALAAEQKQGQPQTPNQQQPGKEQVAADQKQGQGQDQQQTPKEAVKEQVVAEQKTEQRRKQGVRI